MMDIIVTIMVEILSILAITTKEVEQSRASKLILGYMGHPYILTVV
jgi:hypothetical protein